jgi:hypothetical protein
LVVNTRSTGGTSGAAHRAAEALEVNCVNMRPAGQSYLLREVFDSTTLDGLGAKTYIGVFGCAIRRPKKDRVGMREMLRKFQGRPELL